MRQQFVTVTIVKLVSIQTLEEVQKTGLHSETNEMFQFQYSTSEVVGRI
jgi:hypothetical protein